MTHAHLHAGRYLIVVSILFCTCSTVLAQDTTQQNYYATMGITVGFIVPYNTISGDFDGERVLTGTNDIFLLPKVEGNYGWGVTVGIRGTFAAMELSYLTSTHDVTFLGAKGKADFNAVILDFKYYFWADKPIQIYPTVGIGFPWLVVENAHATLGSQGNSSFNDDAFFGTAVTFTPGGGVLLYLSPSFSLGAELIYRWTIFGTVNGIEIDKENTLTGNGPSFNIRATFTL